MFQVLHTRTILFTTLQKRSCSTDLTHFGKFRRIMWTHLETRDPCECSKKSGQDAISRALSAASVPFLRGSFVWMFKQGLIIARAGLQLNI